MKKVRVSLQPEERSYTIHIGTDLFCDASKCLVPVLPILRGHSAMIVSDSNVGALYANTVADAIKSIGVKDVFTFTFPAGESSKHAGTLLQMCEAAAEHRLDRKSVFVGLGGGVTGDMTAFCASIYMRGVSCIQIPTSLLAMIDSSVGGKTGIDLPQGKNLIGTFYQPKLVIADVKFLRTLPEKEIRNGMAELIKHGILFDKELFHDLKENAKMILTLKNLDIMEFLIQRSTYLKASVVMKDEKEQGERMLLNLGHTFGHAVEKLQRYQGFGHGEAVAYGIRLASRFSYKLGFLQKAELVSIENILDDYGMPNKTTFSSDEMLHAMRGDKKNENGKIKLILPHSIGKCEIHTELSSSEIQHILEEVC